MASLVSFPLLIVHQTRALLPGSLGQGYVALAGFFGTAAPAGLEGAGLQADFRSRRRADLGGKTEGADMTFVPSSPGPAERHISTWTGAPASNP